MGKTKLAWSDYIKKFWERIDIGNPDDCWNWKMALGKNGYAEFHVALHKPQRVLAHRFAFEISVGDIPKGSHIDHICGNRACVNPYHLRLVTNQQNCFNKKYQGKSGYKGVYWNKQCCKWCAQISIGKKHFHLGAYADPQKAHEAYCKKAKELFGEYARFN